MTPTRPERGMKNVRAAALELELLCDGEAALVAEGDDVGEVVFTMPELVDDMWLDVDSGASLEVEGVNEGNMSEAAVLEGGLPTNVVETTVPPTADWLWDEDFGMGIVEVSDATAELEEPVIWASLIRILGQLYVACQSNGGNYLKNGEKARYELLELGCFADTDVKPM
ncbi:hypothetical protein PLICRDRAFT_521126 [Plicaturopsis crispa FD-325 SS-3]|nr:hypothetical protein PLICRDRAFT_521126 [Plicaturopsis crispa FD-325 SS-3]